MHLTQFYERYWQRPEATESNDPGLEIEPRKKLLRIALKDIPRSAPVLDAGCGSGAFASFLHQLGIQCVDMIIVLKCYDKHFNPYLSHIRFFSRNSLTACLEHAGFVVENWQGIGRTWPIWKSQFVVCRKIREPGSAPEIVS